MLYDLLDINSSPSELTLYEDASGQLQVRMLLACACMCRLLSPANLSSRSELTCGPAAGARNLRMVMLLRVLHAGGLVA